MAITKLIIGNGNGKNGTRESPESQKANEFFEEYLKQNVRSSETLKSMHDIIREFRKRTPRVKISKCIDGRTHGSKAKGYPPGTVTFSRTEGSNIDTSFSNTTFWSRLYRVVLDAKRHTPGMPALFIALGHRSRKGHGCAAHGEDDAKALEAVKVQATRVGEVIARTALYPLYGMTNTDDMSEMLVFPDGTVLDAEKLIAELDTEAAPLRQPSDVFHQRFLDKQIDDDATRRSVYGLTPREVLHGNEAPIYQDLQTALAMESYLVREITRLQKNGGEHNTLLNERVFRKISDVLNSVNGLPESLKGALLYQTIWNMAYALYQRERLKTMNRDQTEAHLEHAEDLVCYGEGFELLTRNTCILAKTGRGNDEEALQVAKKVLMANRKKKNQQHPPLVHINVEVSGELGSWDAFNDQVLSKITTMLLPVYSVFEEDVRVLTTYSYMNEKRFYPVKIQPEEGLASSPSDPRESYKADVTRNMIDQNFTKPELERRENAYTQYMLLEQAA